MKAGITLNELATRVNANIQARRDFVLNAGALQYVHDEEADTLTAEIGDQGRFAMTNLFTDQFHSHLGVPTTYAKTLSTEDKHLLAYNVNRRAAKRNSTRMIRTLDRGVESGDRVARAYLSNAFRPLDNEAVLQQIIPALGAIPGLQMMETELTENRMYIKAISPKIEGEIKKGDTVQAGLVISNSEVGGGALSISLLVYRLVCLNGLILPDGKFRVMHLGKRTKVQGDETYEMLSDETRAAADRVTLMEARDVAAAIFNQATFDKMLGKIREAAEDQLPTKRPDLAVNVLAQQVGLNGEEQVSVLQHLLQGGDFSRWGFTNAITAMAQEVPSYDRSVQLETLGSKVLELPRKTWDEMAKGA